MYGLDVMLSISTRSTSKNIDKTIYFSLHSLFWSSKFRGDGTKAPHSTLYEASAHDVLHFLNSSPYTTTLCSGRQVEQHIGLGNLNMFTKLDSDCVQAYFAYFNI